MDSNHFQHHSRLEVTDISGLAGIHLFDIILCIAKMIYLLFSCHSCHLLLASAEITGSLPFIVNRGSRGVKVQSIRLSLLQEWEPTAEQQKVQTEVNLVIPHQTELRLKQST